MKNELCQSCGLPLTIDNKGLNANKSQNKEYCHFCFHNGEFTEPKLTLELQKKKLVEMAVSKLTLSEKEALKMANTTLPKLKRWK